MPIELIDERVLGALQLTDHVTQAALTRPLRLTAGNASVIRNRRGYYVVTHAAGLEAHGTAFQAPPAEPGLESNSYTFTIHDPQRRYLPREVVLRLPRDPDPAHIDNANSLFRPHDVAMYPTATAVLAHNWSSIRASVTQGVARSAVRGALLRVIDTSDDSLLASGLSDELGEALVIIPGVPVTKFANEDDGPVHGGGGGGGNAEPPVIVNTLPVRLELSLGATTPWPVNPDLLEQNHNANLRLSMELTLSTGKMERVTINLT